MTLFSIGKMAHTSSQTTIVFIVVALVCAFVPAFSVEEAEAKSLWDTCLLKISPKCALDIIGVVFENLTITDACCHDLKKLKQNHYGIHVFLKSVQNVRKMAHTSSRTTIVFIVVALVCAFLPAFSVEEAEAKSLWDTCLLKISPKCALDIIGVVFENLTITDACCHDLVQEGKMCHDTLIKYIAEKPHLVAHETEYLTKQAEAKLLWDTCLLRISPKCALEIIGAGFENLTIIDACCYDLVQEVKMCHDTLIKYIAEKPHLVAHETEYLTKQAEEKLLWDTCLLKISPKCALEIIGALFENLTIPDACCQDLVQEGKMCHDTLIKYIAEKPHLVSHETEYLKKSDALWTHCVSISQTA
ncbi:hypothetical protein HID58_087046 [Brassica napus]|uniref:Prolamin-like domain-containing protein n=1 Tax=Brassica napus TaxID=3708 RepID=A0ABQ7XS27_BRANA|nr:hypothetical protein HID58_087046 [Brassica napus]